MTREEFAARFKLLDAVRDGPVRTYHAVAPSGAVVMAHVLEDQDEARAILDGIERLEPEKRSRVLEVSVVDGVPVVVTRFILDFDSLHGWMGVEPSQRGVPPTIEIAALPADEPGSPAAGGEASAPGEFTRMFRVPDAAPLESPELASDTPPLREVAAGPPPDSAAAPLSGEEPPSLGAPNPAEKSADGEFTRLFRAPAASADPVPEAAPPLAAAQPSSPPATVPAEAPLPPSAGATEIGTHHDAAGEFTRLFRASAPVPGPVPEPPTHSTGEEPPPPPTAAESRPTAEAADEPGEFTRMFRAATGSGGPSVLPSGAPGAPNLRGPSDHVREPVLSPQAALPPELRAPRLDLPPHVPPDRVAVSPSQPDANAASPHEPGEFTRIFGQQHLPMTSGHPAPPPAPAGPPAEWAGPSPAAPDYLTRLQTPASAPGATPAAGAHYSPPPATPSLGGPSEYTRIIAAQPPPATKPTPAPAPVMPPPAEPVSFWPYVVGLVVLFLAALALILYVVLSGT